MLNTCELNFEFSKNENLAIIIINVMEEAPKRGD